MYVEDSNPGTTDYPLLESLQCRQNGCWGKCGVRTIFVLGESEASKVVRDVEVQNPEQ